MAAAVAAAESSANITVFEATSTLGGRARAFTTKGPDGAYLTLDNGQHILIGAYSEALKMMQRVGLDLNECLLRLPLSMPYPDGSGLQTPPWASHLPAPLNAAAAIATARGWHWRDKLALVKASMGWQFAKFQCSPLLSVADLCASLPSRVMDDLIQPLCVSALNTPVEESSAQVFLRVMQDALFGKGYAGFDASDLLLPRRDLSQLFPEAAAHWLQSRHGDRLVLRRGTRVQSLSNTGTQWRLNLQADGDTFSESFDHVIWATSAKPAAQAMLAAALQKDLPASSKTALERWAAIAGTLPFTAITTVYARSRSARLSSPMLALRASPNDRQAPAQFVFDRGLLSPHDPSAQGVLAFVVSASQGDRADLQERGLDQSANQLGLTDLQPLQTIVEKRATFACTPGLLRPNLEMAPGLWAAGDYVQGPYPATLEGAVRSGLAAAKAIRLAQARPKG